MARSIALALPLLLASCTPTKFAFTPASSRGVAPRASGCTIEVLTSPPTKDYTEVGTLEFYDGTEPKTLAAFRQAVAAQVCDAGGDAVIATASAKGTYTTGSVIEYVRPTHVDAPAMTEPPAK